MKALYLIAAMALLSQVQWSKASVSFFGEGYELGVKAIQAALDIMKEQNSGFDFELVADYGGQQQANFFFYYYTTVIILPVYSCKVHG